MGNRAALTLTHINVKELQKEKSVKISELSSPSSSSGHQMEFSMEVHLCQNYVSIATLCRLTFFSTLNCTSVLTEHILFFAPECVISETWVSFLTV